MTDGATSIAAMRPADQPEEGGSTPTVALFRKADWWVQECELSTARNLVELHHYARGGSNTRVYTHALSPRVGGEAVGCAWWLPPTKSAAKSFAPNWKGVLALSRLVIVPGVPSNACSFLIRHSMRLIDRRLWPTLITYADGWRGHKGKIYEAAGWKFCGWTEPEECFVKDGVMVSRKAGPKTRTRGEMIALGCKCVGKFRKRRYIHRFGAHP